MSDASSSQSQMATKFMVRLSDGRSFGPADMDLIVRWAQEGRVPADAMIEGDDGGPPVRAGDHPRIRAIRGTSPTTPGPLSDAKHIVEPAADGGVSTLIPYRNGCALASYYTGVFSLIPFIGIILGPAAIVLGILGMRYASQNVNAKGRVHAWAGIILGTLVLLLHIAAVVVISRMR